MAEETCVSVTFEADGVMWEYCWEDTHPSTAWKSTAVDTGLRASHRPGQPRTWRTCQYFLKGMAPICKWWKEGELDDDEDTTTSGSYYCSYIKANTSDDPNDPPPDVPTGYNSTQCDFLGRRQWCSKYVSASGIEHPDWICTAPDPYVSGLGRKEYNNENGGTAIFTHVEREDIWGYNDTDDGTGTGKCDCYGMGRGEDGCPLVDFEDPDQTEKRLSKLYVKCNFYRPWQMGFGVTDPDGMDKGDVESDKVTLTEQGWERVQRWSADDSYRLPLNYVLFNNRAAFQKCQWWDEETAREYDIARDDKGVLLITLDGGDAIFNAAGKVEFCKCPDTNSNEFNTRRYETEIAPEDPRLPLDKVQAQGGGPVCNGARPECPCYSGKWEYLTEERMLSGMPVTANQILELRFYMQDWDSQDAYDKYFERKPNFVDPPTASIFTFTKWLPSDSSAVETLQGKELYLCQPAPLNNKVFTRKYIDVTEPINYYNGLIGSSTETGQRQYPSLIREPSFIGLRPLVVSYPYYDNDAFNPEICRQPGTAGYNKIHNNVYGDSIRSVGQTLRSKKVYLINTSEISLINNAVRDYNGIYAIKDKIEDRTEESIKNDIYNSLREVINRGFREYSDYISSATSDTTFGYFSLDPVKLRYGTTNKLLIAVDYGDGTWEYRKRSVRNDWFGGMIKQTLYSSEYQDEDDGYLNESPVNISADEVLAEGQLIPLGFAAQSGGGNEVINTYSIENIDTGIRYYAWSLVEDLVEDSIEEDWGAIGNTNKILLEIEHTGVNYVYNWGVESAKLVIKTETDDEGNEQPVNKNYPEKVNLKTLIEDDDAMSPSACVLTPVYDIRIKFVPSDWELHVDFKYEKLVSGHTAEDYNEVVAGAGASDMDVYSAAPHSVTVTDDKIKVEKISHGSVQFMSHFFAGDDRITSSFATKFLTKIIQERCRNVDIFYRYQATGKKYFLQPEKGFCIDIKQDLPSSDQYKHFEVPDCGDHENDPRILEGPLWYPYNRCRGYDLYDEFTVCNNCQAGYVGPNNEGVARDEKGDPLYAGGGTVLRRNDYRYCGPYKYEAFGDARGNWAATCDCGCTFSYSDASAVTPEFVGIVRRRTTVDLAVYAGYGWVPPPFGNDGREIVEKFISEDYLDHPVPGETQHRSEWLPVVIDHSIFFSTFNAYDSNPEDEYIGISEQYNFEPFRYTHQLNMVILPTVNEEIVDYGRYRWEELFTVHHEGNCSYPLPAYSIGGGRTKALFYYFKPKWGSWAWQEGWKDIERDQEFGLYEDDVLGPEGKLDFVELERPKYIFDTYKTEHRRLADEGYYTLEYEAPKLDEEGNMEKYPTLSIGKKNPHAFKIFYDEDSYDDTLITWRNEGADAQVDGASDKDNIYEKAFGSDWVNDRSTLFDDFAVSGTEDANKLVSSVDGETGDETYKYYNRGVIANITRSQLYNLPKNNVDLTYYKGDDGVSGAFRSEEIIILTKSTEEAEDTAEMLIPGIFVWDTYEAIISSHSEEESEQAQDSWAFIKLKINGNWGMVDGLNSDQRHEIYTLYRAGVSISYEFTDGTFGDPRGATTLSTEVKEPVEGQEVESYFIYLEFLLGPVEMLQKRVKNFSITLSGGTGGYISINDIKLVHSEYKERQHEKVVLWERKYILSTFSGTGNINLNGPDDYLHYQEDGLNSGQYFPFRGARLSDQEVVAADKMRVISTGIHYSEDDPLDEASYDNLHEIELEEQRELYEDAYELDPDSDSNIYTAIVPIKYSHFMDTYSLQMPLLDLEVNSQKLPWKKHALVKQFVQYEYWRPGGHYYKWSDGFRREKCMLFGGAEDVFSGEFVHVDHQGAGNPLADASTPIDPGNSYYSLRFYTQVAKYNRAMIIAGGEPEGLDSSKYTGIPGTFI